MGIDMSNNPPNSNTKDFFASPALSLSLAGIFRHADAAAAAADMEVEEGDEGSGGGGCSGSRREDITVEVSSENSGPIRSIRSDDDIIHVEGEHDVEVDDDDNDIADGDKTKKRKRKKYHRHNAQQIRIMEA